MAELALAGPCAGTGTALQKLDIGEAVGDRRQGVATTDILAGTEEGLSRRLRHVPGR